MDIVVDVGGPATLSQSLKAVRPEGLISITGLLGSIPGSGEVQSTTLLDCLVYGCVARGVLLGTREQFDEMNVFIEKKCVRLAVDERVFGFEGVKEVYKYLMGQEHSVGSVSFQLHWLYSHNCISI